MVGIDLRTSHILGVCSAAELYNPVQEGADLDLPVKFGCALSRRWALLKHLALLKSEGPDRKACPAWSVLDLGFCGAVRT